MLFLSNLITHARSPYRVERVENNLDGRQGSSDQRPDDDKFSPENLEKAAKKFKEKKINATAMQSMEPEFIILSGDWSVKHAIEHIHTEDCDICAVTNKKGKFLGLIEKSVLADVAKKDPSILLHTILSPDTICADLHTEIMEIIPTFISKKLKAIPVLNDKHQIQGILLESSFIQTMIKVMYQAGFLELD